MSSRKAGASAVRLANRGDAVHAEQVRRGDLAATGRAGSGNGGAIGGTAQTDDATHVQILITIPSRRVDSREIQFYDSATRGDLQEQFLMSRVLIVDDDLLMLATLEAMLVDEGFEVVAVD